MTFPRRVALTLGLAILPAPLPVLGQTNYDIGPVFPQEQFYIELINRARANLAAEGASLAALGTSDLDISSAYPLCDVDLALMQSEMSALSPAAPLVPNTRLRTAALRRYLDMARSDTSRTIPAPRDRPSNKEPPKRVFPASSCRPEPGASRRPRHRSQAPTVSLA